MKKTKTKQNKKRKEKRKVISVIKIGLDYGEPNGMSLEILLHEFCTFGIFYIVRSLVKLCQNR